MQTARGRSFGLSVSRFLQSSLQRNGSLEMSLTWNMCCDFIYKIPLKLFFHWRRIDRYIITNLEVKSFFFQHILNETVYCRQISVNISDIKCQENHSNGNGIVLCGCAEGETDKRERTVTSRRCFAKISENLSQYIRCHSRDSIGVLQIRIIARLQGAFNQLEAKPYCISFGVTSNRTVK